MQNQKTCRDCAYFCEDMPLAVLGPSWDMSLRGVGRTIGNPTVISTGCSCGKSNPSFDSGNTCEDFLQKKQGMTLGQQLEEIKQQKDIEEKNRLAKEKQDRIDKENRKLVNRIKSCWKIIVGVGVIVGIIAGIIKIIEFFI
jgi:hypothetical protein